MHAKGQGGGSPVAFVEFQDVRCAGHAKAALHGTFLLSSDRGAIRVEYAKAKMAEVKYFSLLFSSFLLFSKQTSSVHL